MIDTILVCAITFALAMAVAIAVMGLEVVSHIARRK